jgi:DNA invertase Pin-like site-specific DNA recombinase
METLALLRAILYARRSQKQDNQASVTDQVSGGREACAENGWTLAAIIDQDDDRSASRFARRGRPGWDELLALLRAGEVNVVILWESSRGDRKLSEWAAFLDECRTQNVRIHVVSHERTYDLRKSRDWKTLADDGVNSAYESEYLSGRVKRGMKSAARRGELHAVAPYGLRTVYGRHTAERQGWEIVEERAEIVREIIRRIGKHEPIKAIRRDLNDRGIPSARGGNWADQTIRYLAMNPTYAGLIRLEDGELIPGKFPAIVKRSEWNDAMAVLGPRKTGIRPASQRHLLTYLGNCFECKGPLVVRTYKGEFRYSCRKGCIYLSRDWVDEFVADVICARLSRSDARDLFKSDDKRSAALRDKIAELRAQLDEWAAADISARAYAIKEAKLLPDIERAERELMLLSAPPALHDILSAADVRAAWDACSVQAKRAIISAVTGIQVGKRLSGGPNLDERRVTFTWKPVQRPGKGAPRLTQSEWSASAS